MKLSSSDGTSFDMNHLLLAALLSVVACGPRAPLKAADASWRLASTSGPSPRALTAMAYDPTRDRTVLFGGESRGDRLDDTWEWDGASWSEITVPADSRPPARFFHSMTYDPTLKRVVMWGGIDSGDQWEWDGVAWSKRSGIGPVTAGQIGFDVRAQQLIAVGNDNNTFLTAAFREKQWSIIGAAPETTGATMAVDADREALVLFGGRIGSSLSNRIWERTDGWRQRPTLGATGPAARSGQSMAYDASRLRTVLFGGADEQAGHLGDTWEWDGTDWSGIATGSASPPARSFHAMAYDSKRSRVVVFGGFGDSGALGDTWER